MCGSACAYEELRALLMGHNIAAQSLQCATASGVDLCLVGFKVLAPGDLNKKTEQRGV